MTQNKKLIVIVGAGAIGAVILGLVGSLNAFSTPQQVTTGAVTTNTTNATVAAAPTNATTNATANSSSGVITSLTWYGSPDIVDQMLQFTNPTGPLTEQPLSSANIQYQKTDPAFAKLVKTMDDCLTHYNSMLQRMATTAANYPFIEEKDRQNLCTDTIGQGLELMCDASDFANYDIARCEEARAMTDVYLAVAGTLYVANGYTFENYDTITKPEGEELFSE